MILAQDWPSLFKSEDFMLNSKKNLNENEIFEGKKSEEEVRQKIYQTFHFISDFTSETRGERPRGWVNPSENPQKSLEIGYPEEIIRKSNPLHFPVYPLIQLSYFKGDSESNAQINLCQTFWVQEEYQKAYTCFAQLQFNLQKGIYPSTPILQLQINMLEAFFLLHLLMINEMRVKNVDLSTKPITYGRFRPGEMMDIVTTLFTYIATHYKKNFFLPKEKSHDILKNYSDFYNYPSFLIKNKFNFDKMYNLTLNKEAVDVLTWIRTVLPIIYINAIAFNDEKPVWVRGNEIIDRLENYFKLFHFPDKKKGSAIYIKDLPIVNEEIYFKPLNNTDMLMVGDVFKTNSMQNSMELDTALKSISKGILRNGDPNLAALLFKMSGDAYYDLNILHLARRSYSWSELVSRNFPFENPAALFYGAESAFWLGQYDVAEKGFKRFLLSTGDRNFIPKARLRLGSINQILGRNQIAQSYFNMIVRNTPKNAAAQDARVNLFCMTVNKMTPKVRKLEYKKVTSFIAEARPNVQRQAKACLMASDLMDATADSFNAENKKNVIEKANIQKDLIQKYQKEFPDNEFMSLFSDRIKFLELSEASWIAYQDQCKELIDYYEKNKLKLNYLAKNNNKYVKGLKWSPIERKKLLRCSAFLKENKLWKEARQFDVGQDGNPLQDKFYNLATKPSVQSALDVYFELKNSAKNWDSKLKRVEKAGPDLIERDDFWEFLAIRQFLNYEFTSSKSAKNLLSNSIIHDLIREPKTIFELPLFCDWFLRGFDNLTPTDFDIVAKIKQPNEWLELLTNSANKVTCETIVAQQLLAQSIKNPSDLRDTAILRPFLEKKGIEEASEDWLSLAQRLEKTKGTNNEEVIDIYKKLAETKKDSSIKKTAFLWLKKNSPKDADKILW